MVSNKPPLLLKITIMKILQNVLDYSSLLFAIVCVVIGIITKDMNATLGWFCCALWIIRLKVNENHN